MVEENGILYDDGDLKITYLGKLPDEHLLYIDKVHFVLRRGILEELARTTELPLLKEKLGSISEDSISYAIDVDKALIQKIVKDFPGADQYPINTMGVLRNLGYQRIGIALSQARIKDLESQLDDCRRNLDDNF